MKLAGIVILSIFLLVGGLLRVISPVGLSNSIKIQFSHSHDGEDHFPFHSHAGQSKSSASDDDSDCHSHEILVAIVGAFFPPQKGMEFIRNVKMVFPDSKIMDSTPIVSLSSIFRPPISV